MALSPEDFRQLTQVMQDLTRVSKEQLSVTKGQAQSATGPSGSTAQTQLLGFSSSVARSLAASAGQAGGALSGAISAGLSGGPLAAAAAGIGAAANFAGQLGRASQQGFINAPLFSGNARAQFEAGVSSDSFALNFQRGVDAPFNALGVEGPSARVGRFLLNKFAPGLGNLIETDPSKLQRGLDEEAARKRFPADATAQQVSPFFESFAAAGGTVTDEEIRASARRLVEQNRRRFEVHRKVVQISNEEAGFRPEIQKR